MWQQIIALILLSLFLIPLLIQKKKKQIQKNEFIFWFIFWFLAILAIIFIKQIDLLLINIGFSGTGINFLLYLALFFLFYLIFKLRIKLSKLEKQLTQINRTIALNNEKYENRSNSL